MSEYRPEGLQKWNEKTHEIVESLGPLPPQTEFPIAVSNSFDWSMLRRRIFEAGADAILEALKKEGVKVDITDQLTMYKNRRKFILRHTPDTLKGGTLVIIPD